MSKRASKTRARNGNGNAKGTDVTLIPRCNLAVPQFMRVTLPFVETWDNTTAVPGHYDWVLRGNSPYDPDYALSADSAYGFERWQGLYYQYKVVGSRIKVTIRNNDEDDPVNVAIIPVAWADSFVAANQDGHSRHPFAKTMVVAYNDGAKTCQNVMSSAKMFGVRDLDSVNFSALTSTNPATVWYWHVMTYNNAGVASDCEMRVEVEYDTVFFNANSLTQ